MKAALAELEEAKAARKAPAAELAALTEEYAELGRKLAAACTQDEIAKYERLMRENQNAQDPSVKAVAAADARIVAARHAVGAAA